MGEDGMTSLREAAQQALEALEYHVEQTRPIWKTSKAIVALMAALEQPEQEPVAWMTHGDNTLPLFHKTLAAALVWGACPTPLYPHPPRRDIEKAAAAEREKVAHWMRNLGYATGHGDTIEDLLDHLGTQISEGLEVEVTMEREACAKVADLVAREIDDTNGTATYVAAAIRARSKT
jgi:hypothetical protein